MYLGVIEGSWMDCLSHVLLIMRLYVSDVIVSQKDSNGDRKPPLFDIELACNEK